MMNCILEIVSIFQSYPKYFNYILVKETQVLVDGKKVLAVVEFSGSVDSALALEFQLRSLTYSQQHLSSSPTSGLPHRSFNEAYARCSTSTPQTSYFSYGSPHTRFPSPSQGFSQSPTRAPFRSPSGNLNHSPSQAAILSRSPANTRSPFYASYWNSPSYSSQGGRDGSFSMDDTLGSAFNQSIGSPGFYYFPVGSPAGRSRQDDNNNVDAYAQRRRAQEASASPSFKKDGRKSLSLDRDSDCASKSDVDRRSSTGKTASSTFQGSNCGDYNPEKKASNQMSLGTAAL